MMTATVAASLPRRTIIAGLLLALLCASAAVAQPAPTARPEEPPPHLDEALVDEALSILGKRFVHDEALDTQTLTRGAIRGMLEALGDDGHTEYLTPDEQAAARDALEGRVLGIGVVLDQRSTAPLVIAVIDGSPADRAGLRPGDVIAAIDGTPTARLPADALGTLVRGDAGSHVALEVERPGEPGRLSFDITREDVAIEPASSARVPGSNVAVVRIVQFSDGAGDRTREAIASALDSGAQGIVLDLRGNPGGLVDEALDVAAAFLDGGVAYQEQGRDGPPREVDIPSGRAMAAEVPLIVLVDYATASSAEILAAALRDNGRAAIVGQQTFGTGTVVHTFDLSDGSALKVGVLTWMTPSGDVVFGVGIAPDHEVEAPPGATILRPRDLATMSPSDLASSDDLPLRRAVGLLEPLARAD
jgi:carboxyl-terminal processing protease